ncbi:MAG: metallophosphoesterase [Clostridiales Family XIII bacterium]|jgi:3',5'-cyclic AMP phosphodiesterase CpdA|nr:metallophosphoesterase [Clostridiales Family XIII bacterium]
MRELTARAGMTIRASTGLESLDAPDRMSTIFFSRASAGDVLRLLDDVYLFNVATYDPNVDEKYIYTYAYQANESWLSYNGDLSGDTYRRDDYVFSKTLYFRVCLKRANGADIRDEEAANIDKILVFETATSPNGGGPSARTPLFLTAETDRVVRKIEEKRRSDSLVFALLSDTHITVNGTFGDTVASLKAVHKHADFDGVVFLGDLTDGMVTAAATRRYTKDAIGELRSLGVPLYMVIGNHDANYFAGNREPFSIKEQCALYLSHSDDYVVRETDNPWYYVDFPDRGLRFVFLHSFDGREEARYGFSDECLLWLKAALAAAPPCTDIVVFSHLTPLVKLQYWTDRIRGGHELVGILEAHGARPGAGKILAYINGHNHADQVYEGLSFPIISVGCAKTECFEAYKPAGSHTPARRLGDASQELWDALLIAPSEKHLDFVRFGAGEDRTITVK